MANFHVWIHQGPNLAATNMVAPDLDNAKDEASKLWNEPRENITGHSHSQCGYGCDPFLSAEEFY